MGLLRHKVWRTDEGGLAGHLEQLSQPSPELRGGAARILEDPLGDH